MKYVVVIPAKNEQDSIRNTLESIVGQTIPPKCVLVMDDGSTDNTPNIVRSMQIQNPVLKHHTAQSDNFYSLGVTWCVYSTKASKYWINRT
ncbi:MAG: glycosyltransferase [Gammaproteobacteria bacterium]|nr:glycosyltransferase [Gammaproteobacteria bacterium]